MAEPFIKIDVEQVRELQRKLDSIAGDSGILRAMAAALNKTASKGKTDISKSIREDIRVTAGEVRDILRGPNDTPANKATFTRLRSAISGPTRGLTLGRFLSGTKQSPPKVKVKPTGASKPIPTGFIIPLANSGLPGIFIREGTGIRHLYGPSVSQVFTSDKDDVAPLLQVYLAVQLKTEAESVLRRKLLNLI